MAIAAIAAAFLAFSGAFGTGEVGFPSRLLYWLILMGVGLLAAFTTPEPKVPRAVVVTPTGSIVVRF